MFKMFCLIAFFLLFITAEMLSLGRSKHTPNVKQASNWNIPEKYDAFWEKAKEIYHKIEYLEKQHNEVSGGPCGGH